MKWDYFFTCEKLFTVSASVNYEMIGYILVHIHPTFGKSVGLVVSEVALKLVCTNFIFIESLYTIIETTSARDGSSVRDGLALHGMQTSIGNCK